MTEKSTYLIEDDFHDDSLGGTYSTLEDALAEVYRIISLPFEQEPHSPPCTNWHQCRREFVIREVHTFSSARPTGPSRTTIAEFPILTTSSIGVVWAKP
ncbi:unnamed protein product, partial [Phaeothamnion confervicola]